MKRFLKSYLVFTSLIYRIVMFIVVPIVMIAVILWQGGVFGKAGSLNLYEFPGVTVSAFVMMLLPMIEIVSDTWMFGGIQSKDAAKLDYLKTSSIGIKVLRRALSIDLVRKFILAVGIIGISYGVLYWRLTPELKGANTEGDWEMLLFALLVSYFFSVLGTVLTRYGSMIWLNMMAANLIELIILMIDLACTFNRLYSRYIVDFCVLSAILDVAVSILAVRIVMKKVEGSYYDK
ncbi:MAG: hypothetical protein K2N85_02510 [Lachnospiraceae bacterium]|nr:hypothetical protein [Lachnospiraceae bacterium]